MHDVAAADWLDQIREPKSPAPLNSNQLSVFPHTERLVPDSGTSETSTCTYFDFVNISSPDFIRVGTFFFLVIVLKTKKIVNSCLLLLPRDGEAQCAATKSLPDL